MKTRKCLIIALVDANLAALVLTAIAEFHTKLGKQTRTMPDTKRRNGAVSTIHRKPTIDPS